ncbi:hypothetical protein KBY67_11930 [Synechococcus sp. RedBA-s]|nr:hypothetical protein [Synechococcus sp. RedBA-s]
MLHSELIEDSELVERGTIGTVRSVFAVRIKALSTFEQAEFALFLDD